MRDHSNGNLDVDTAVRFEPKVVSDVVLE
jgi:hypothetical protein